MLIHDSLSFILRLVHMPCMPPQGLIRMFYLSDSSTTKQIAVLCGIHSSILMPTNMITNLMSYVHQLPLHMRLLSGFTLLGTGATSFISLVMSDSIDSLDNIIM